MLKGPSGTNWEFEGFRVMTGMRHLIAGGTPVPLTAKAFDTLVVLVENSDRVVTKDELLRSVWPDVEVEEGNLTQQIFLLRKALGETAQQPRHIVTIPGHGYRFTARVNAISDDAAATAVSTSGAASPPDAPRRGVTFYAGPGEAVGEAPLEATSPPDVPVHDPSRPLAALSEAQTRWPVVAVGSLVAASLLAVAGAFGWMWIARGTTAGTRNERAAQAVRFTIDPPSGHTFGNGPGPANAASNVETTTLAVSPDGTRLAMVLTDVSGRTRVWIRRLAALEAQPLPSTDGALSVFWSRDGRSIGFPADGKLKRLDLATGTAVALCDLPAHPAGVYGTWGADAIVYSAGTQILRVSTEGGTPEVAVQLDPDEDGAKWPWFLPDGRRFLYMARLRTREGRVKLMSPGRPAVTVLTAATSNVQWVDPGFLVFAKEGSLVAQSFDPDTGRTTGELLPVAAPVIYSRSTARAAFAVSASGVLVYQSQGDSSRLQWVDATGTSSQVVATGDVLDVRISPNGNRALFSRATPALGTYDLWYVDLARGAEWRLTSEPTSEIGGQWQPDSGGVVFSAERQGPPHLVSRRLDGDKDRELRPPGSFSLAYDVTSDGVIAFWVVGEPTRRVVWGVSVDGAGEPVPLISARFDIEDLRFSPGGELVAFVSSDSEHPEIYVAEPAAPHQRVRVSSGGGRVPRWGRRGGELFYLSRDGRMMSATIGVRPSLSASATRTLFTVSSEYPWVDYDVAPDGRFLAIVPETVANQQPLTVLLNWLPVK